MMKINIVTRPYDDNAMGFARRLKKFLGDTVHYTIINPIEYISDCDLVISVGGDGTFLNAIGKMGDQQVPIVGVNFGGVGFMADIDPKYENVAFMTIFDMICNKGFNIEERMRVDCSIDNKYITTAMNEIAIKTQNSSKMIDIKVHIDDEITECYKGDGVIISTPTGSTAYAMSAGGPIIDPSIKSILMVPVAPYLMSARPELIGINKKLSIEIGCDESSTKPDVIADIISDGFIIQKSCNETITFKESKYPAKFIKTDQKFFTKVGKKLRR